MGILSHIHSDQFMWKPVTAKQNTLQNKSKTLPDSRGVQGELTGYCSPFMPEIQVVAKNRKGVYCSQGWQSKRQLSTTDPTAPK